MKKKILWLVALAVMPQFICAAALTNDFSNKELKEEISASLTQSQEQASARNALLLRAARENKPLEVKALLLAGADINTKEEGTNKTPLYLASENGNTEIVDILLANENILVDKMDNKSFTPLIIASAKGHKDIITKLVQKGAELNFKTKNGFTPLLMAVWNKQIPAAVHLIKTNFGSEQSPLKANIHIRNNYGDNALLLSVVQYRSYSEPEMAEGQYVSGDRLAIVKALMERGVNVNTKDSDGNTPLILALMNKKIAISTELLKSNKIDVKATNNRKVTALHYTPNLHITNAITLKGADVNAKDEFDNTPLMSVAMTNDFHSVNLLILEHAQTDAVNIQKENAIIHAIHGECNLQIIKLLMDNGGAVRPDFKDQYGRTLRDLLTKDYDDVYCYDSKVVLDIVFPKK